MKTSGLSLTILGSSCSIPRPGRACSSYLIEDEGQRVVLDFGTGAFANLRQHVVPEMLDAVIISHMHTDHFLDLIPLRYALRYGTRMHNKRILVYVPPGGIDMLERLGESLSRESGDFFHDVYELREFDPASNLSLGSANLQFTATTHYITAYAIRYNSGAASIVYSADTAYDERVMQLAAGASLFLCEATLGAHGVETNGVKGHICAEEAGRLATLGKVESLVLTHYGADCDVAQLERAARAAFAGNVTVADDHMKVLVRGGASNEMVVSKSDRSTFADPTTANVLRS